MLLDLLHSCAPTQAPKRLFATLTAGKLGEDPTNLGIARENNVRTMQRR
jgi:hypothetical protein